MKKGNKKAQFYLLAAMIIISIIIGFAAVSNYSKSKSFVRVYDLGEELGIESEAVLDFGIYNNKDISELLDNFTEKYSDYLSEENRQIYFIFGNIHEVTIRTYEEVSAGEICIENSCLEITDSGYYEETINPQGNKVEITINDIKYEFKLKPGENFYFVITQEIGGEEYIVTG